MKSKNYKIKKLYLSLGKLCSLFLILCSINIILSFKNIDFASAVSYQSSTNVQFTFNPTLSMSVSGDLVIDSLAPGSSSDSNVITVSINTNSAYGYQLSATVGTKTEGEDALVNGNNEFTNLTSNVSSLSNFSDNSWGYSYSTDSGTNWISGNVGSSSSGYNGLPLDNNDDTNLLGCGGVTLIDTNTLSNNNSIQFKIGAKASTTQPAGTYTNTVNFYAVTYKAPVNLYEAYRSAGKSMYRGYYKIQDLDSVVCGNTEILEDPLDVIDVRDNEVYKITKLADNNCWLLDNLRLDPTDLTVAANMTSSNTNATDQALSCLKEGSYNGVACASPYPTIPIRQAQIIRYIGGTIDNTYKNTVAPTAYGQGSGIGGVLYNYCAASGGSYCYPDGASSGNGVYDICPINWKIPASSVYKNLYENSYNKNTSNFLNAISALFTGYSPHNNGIFFWTTTYRNGSYMYFAFIDSNKVNTTNSYTTNSGRGDLAFIRCYMPTN